METATRTVVAGALALGGVLAAGTASAQAYVGGSIGQSIFEKDIADGLITSGKVDGNDVGFKVFGGYQFHRNFAVEGAYVDLGKAGYEGDFGGLPVTGGKVKVNGVNLSAVGLLPVSESATLFGKIGAYAWEAKASDTTAGVPFSAKKDGVDPSFGIGMSYDITRNLVARIEGEYYKIDNAGATLITVGLAYRFGR